MKGSEGATPGQLAYELPKTHTAATTSDIASTTSVRAAYMSKSRAGALAVIGFVRWVVFEVLPLPMSTRAYHVVGVVCRLVGCGVSFGVLTVELQASAGSHGDVLALLWASSALTAVLIGNIAREWMFWVCTSVANFMGHAFHRVGVTLGGRTFLEIYYPTMTWVRCECGAGEFSYEWTEPTGRCNRVDVQFRASSGRNVEKWRPAIRVTTAPRIISD
jgi:hypothetical protein